MIRDTPQPQQTQLPRWANDQDGWVRSIVFDVLKAHTQCAAGDIDRYLNVLLAEKRLSDNSIVAVPTIEEKQQGGSPVEPVHINCLKLGHGINAIKAGVQIDFASGMTVIFGENGSGKSGFVRVLKRAAGVRTAEDILPDVRGAERPTPSGHFDITVGAIRKTVEWKNDFGIEPLNRVSVFDARGARLHVEEDLTYVYTPGDLAVFPLIQDGIERVRTALEEAIRARTPGTNTLLVSFHRSCAIYAAIETLGAATDIEEIRNYAVMPDDADATLETLKTEVDALKSAHMQNALKQARDRAAFLESFKAAIGIAKEFDISRYAALVEACGEAAARRDEAGANEFNDLRIRGSSTEEWRAFIQAGENYLKKHAAEDYPRPTDACVYCQQPLSAGAIELLQKFRDFANSDIKIAFERAEREQREYLAPLCSLNTRGLSERYSAEMSGENDSLTRLAAVVDQIGTLCTNVVAHSAVNWSEKDEELTDAEKTISEESARLDRLISNLQTSVERRQEALREKEANLIELQNRRVANSLWPQIERRVDDAKWVSRASLVRNGITGVLRSLTEAAKGASGDLLNKGFERRFHEECLKLRAPNVTLNFPGRQGQVTRRKMVAEYKPHQVLSEGEQKALALADFLAEVTAVPASSPVVFDDPITSMDYRRIHDVCDRIAALAREHQVVVFTHNIWFAAELLGKADKKTLKFYDIRFEGGDSGVLSSATHPRVDTVAQMKGRVANMIDAAEKADGEVKAALVEKGYEHLRGLCEIVVEHEMLKGVVQRYAPNVMMTRVDKININKLAEGTETVVPIFEKACRYIASHSQPIETQGIRPTLDELRADYEAVLRAREPHL